MTSERSQLEERLAALWDFAASSAIPEGALVAAIFEAAGHPPSPALFHTGDGGTISVDAIDVQWHHADGAVEWMPTMAAFDLLAEAYGDWETCIEMTTSWLRAVADGTVPLPAGMVDGSWYAQQGQAHCLRHGSTRCDLCPDPTVRSLSQPEPHPAVQRLDRILAETVQLMQRTPLVEDDLGKRSLDLASDAEVAALLSRFDTCAEEVERCVGPDGSSRPARLALRLMRSYVAFARCGQVDEATWRHRFVVELQDHFRQLQKVL